MKQIFSIFWTLVLLLAAGLGTAQATIKTVTYTITDWEITNNTVYVTFTRSGDAPFDTEADETFTAYFTKSSLGTFGDKAGSCSVALADGFNLHAYWSAGSNVQITNNCFFSNASGISYSVSCNQEYYVMHVTMKDADKNGGNDIIKTTAGMPVDDNFDNVSGFNQTYKSYNQFGKLIVTYSDVPTKLDLTLNEADGRYWGSFYSSAGYRLPEGAAAYTMNEYHNLYRVGTDGRTIPATTAVVILSDKKDITLNSTTESATLHGNNILKGSVSPVTLTNGLLGDAIPYVIGVVSSTLGLYKFNGSELPAGKAFVANGTEIYLNTLTSDYTAKNGQTLIGTLTSNVQISIEDGATVTLQDVSISAGSSAGITCNGNAILILSGTNMVQSTANGYPGIQPGGSGTTLTIKGTGSLHATGKASGAGIGSGSRTDDCGNIIIKSGTIIASGVGNKGNISGGGMGVGPGIGCAGDKKCGNITISGGDVSASGGYFSNTSHQFADAIHSAPGIGSSGNGSCGNITISGGSVTALSSEKSTAIGSGDGKGGCGDITITTDVIRVKASPGFRAIDCIGRSITSNKCTKVTIGGVVYWDGTSYQHEGESYLSGSKDTFIYEPTH